MNKTTRVKVIFPANQPNRPSWPYINYDVEGKRDEVIGALSTHLPDCEFSPSIVKSAEEAKNLVKSEGKEFDGFLVYKTALWNGVGQAVAREAYPVVVSDDMYAGSGGILGVNTLVRNENLPVVTVASSNFKDTIEAVRLFGVMKRLREANIVVVRDQAGGMTDKRKHIEPLGTTRILLSSERFQQYYEGTDENRAREVQKRWIEEALRVVEPDEGEILKSARMYLALKAIMGDFDADAISVDCLGLYYSNKLPAYPCLGFFQLNNDGSTGVCEADTDSTVTQLMLRYLTGRPGYVSDPVIDTAANQIIYAHCVATNRVFGPTGLANPYIIRSHAEDRRGAAVQSIMPLGEEVTTVKINPQKKCFAIHNGRTVANVNDEKGCRTKLAAKVDAQRIFDNYHSDLFGWHRVTCYGDYRKQCMNLARLYGLQIYES